MSTAVNSSEVFHRTRSTDVMRNVPRFGHSNNFTDLFASEPEQKDYIAGLLFAGIFMFAIFFAWTVLLFVFKLVGPKRFGFLAGAPFAVSPTTKRSSSSCVQPRSARSIFIFATIALITFSVLFVTNGLTNLRNTVIVVHDSSQNINDVLFEINRIIDDLKALASNSANTRNVLVETLGGLGRVCVLEAAGGTNPALDEELTEFVQVLNALGNFTFNETSDLEAATQELSNQMDSVTTTSSNIDLGDWQALVILIPYILVPVLLLIGVILAWLKIDLPKVRCLLIWFVLPIFIFLVVFAYSFASGILMAGSGNADFCSGGKQQSPDQTVLEIFYEKGFTDDDLVVKIVKYYISQCFSEDPFYFLTTYADEIQTVKQNITDFAVNAKAAAAAALNQTCVSESSTMQSLADNLKDDIQVLSRNVYDALNILRCENIVTLYTYPVYDGTCTYSINGVTWAFASFTVVGFMGLVMIMFRSSFLLDVDESDVYDATGYGYGEDTAAQNKGVGEEEYNNNGENQDGYDNNEYDDYNNNNREARDASTMADDPPDGDEWLQSEFTVPDNVRLDDDNDTIATSGFPTAGGNNVTFPGKTPPEYASPY